MLGRAGMGLVFVALVGCGDGEAGDTAGGGTPDRATIHGCGDDDYQAAANITFDFTQYAPRCATVSAGDTVTWTGTFASHNLQGGSVEGGKGTADASSPIGLVSTGTEATVTFPAAGDFPYYCVQHQSVDMVGVIRVE
jgi:plastocyanin